MPSSAWENHDFATAHYKALAPVDVIDAGPGSGKWAKVLAGRPHHPRPGEHWTGIEIFPRYITDYDLTTLYDRIVVDDIRTSLDLIETCDLLILGDILEHLPEDQAHQLMADIRAIGCALLVAGPIIRFEQGSWGGNTHETHLWHPTLDDWLEMVEPDHFALGNIVGTFWRDPRP